MNAKKLPAVIEDALDRLIDAVTASAGIPTDMAIPDEQVRLLDRAERAKRKLRRAIAANLAPDAVTEDFTFEEGQEVVWLITEGAGGSYKPNAKRPLRCQVVKVGKRGVQVQPIEGWRSRDARPSWVQRRSLLPITHRKAKKLLAERKFVV